MAFTSKVNLQNENGCLMDTDASSLGSPKAVMSDSWIPKEFTNSSFSGTGFSDTSGRLVFIPVQVASSGSTSASIVCLFSYEGTFTGTIGGFGQTTHTVVLNDIAPEGSYVELHGVSISCSIDDDGYAVYGSWVDTSKSNTVKFQTVDSDSDSSGSIRTFGVRITGTALISNTNFGLGQLFPSN